MNGRYKFCIWLLDRLSRGRMTFNEIVSEWERASVNDDTLILSKRTFLRYRNLAEELFNVSIECHKPTNEYWVDMNPMEYTDRWTLSAVRLQNLNSIAELRRYIMLEPPPAGTELVKPLAEACRERRQVSMDYKSPYTPKRRYSLVPCFLRLFKQRWYVTGKQEGKDYLTTLALERMSDISIGETPDTAMEEMTPETYYKDSFGVIVQGEPERIVVRAFKPQDTYLKEVPIHESQQIVDETEDWTDFSLYLRAGYDFKQELLWQRDKLTVISPEWLRKDMADILRRMLKSYETGLSFYKDE